MAEKVLNSIDLNAQNGLRDRAILLLLMELGLRAAEVAKLRLTDLDWARATISIDGKAGRGAIVPLTQRSGDAIKSYLEMGRQASHSDRVFLRSRHPHVPFSERTEVSAIAQKALARCGFRGGAHVFRHTLATELLRDGSTIEEVATILRHRSIQTTTIYAKVNEPMLQRLAVPWMGDEQ